MRSELEQRTQASGKMMKCVEFEKRENWEVRIHMKEPTECVKSSAY